MNFTPLSVYNNHLQIIIVLLTTNLLKQQFIIFLITDTYVISCITRKLYPLGKFNSAQFIIQIELKLKFSLIHWNN